MELHLNESQIIPGTLIIQDGEYLIISEQLRTLARPEEIGYIAYRKQSRGFYTENNKNPEYDLEIATSSHLKHYSERNGGQLHLYADANNNPLIYKDKVIIK